MRLRSKLYLWLNQLCGAPRVTSPEATRAHHTAKAEETRRDYTIPFLERISGAFTPSASVLVVGCDERGLEIGWIARNRGCRLVVGTDIDFTVVDTARTATTDLKNARFVHVGESVLPFADETFDAIFMRNVCEHLINIDVCFTEYRRVLKRGGVLCNSFTPLFYSPFGAHFAHALRFPWGHLIFGLQSVLEIRNLYYPEHVEARTWDELGLNRITERRYRSLLSRVGLRPVSYAMRTTKSLPVVGTIPFLRNLFVLSVESVLVRSDSPAASVELASSR
jgi:SAM-dependent methyltransferase